MDSMISLDLGKGGGIAYWDFSGDIRQSCREVYGWDLGSYDLISKGLNDITFIVDSFFWRHRGDVVVEKPGRHLPYQWILYMDIKTLASKYKVGYSEYHPITIKKVITGSGKATKSDIQEAVSTNLELPDYDKYTEHVYDAVSVGLCHLKTVGLYEF